MRKGAAGSCEDPKFRKWCFQHLCGCYLFNASGLPPRGFFYVRCCWDKRTINMKCAQEIMKAEKLRHKKDEGISRIFHKKGVTVRGIVNHAQEK